MCFQPLNLFQSTLKLRSWTKGKVVFFLKGIIVLWLPGPFLCRFEALGVHVYEKLPKKSPSRGRSRRTIPAPCARGLIPLAHLWSSATPSGWSCRESSSILPSQCKSRGYQWTPSLWPRPLATPQRWASLSGPKALWATSCCSSTA